MEKESTNIIIGITGTLGAGKGTVVEYLVQQKGFAHFSARAFIIEEVERRNLAVDRDSITAVANDLTAQHSSAYIAEMLYERAAAVGGDAVIESIRREGEIELLRRKGHFFLVAVDADPQTRYQRVVARNSVTDRISLEKFLSDERREMNSDDPTKQNLYRCSQLADYRIDNNGDLTALHLEVEGILLDIALTQAGI